MKALVCRQHGPPSDLVYTDLRPPELTGQAVRVRVHSAGVNFPDTLIIAGKYQVQPPLPFAPGFEIAGEVIETAADVEHLAVGDRVLGLVRGGGFAEETVVPAAKCFRIPDSMTFETAGAFGMAYGTALYALLQRGQLHPGETLVVHGATGGVGTAAIQIGQRLGANVIASTSSPKKRAALQENFGVEHVVDAREGQSAKDAIKALTGGRGADVIFDPVGGDVFEQSLRCINWDGRILVVGFASGRIASARTNLLLLKGSSVIGVFWGEFASHHPDAYASNFERLFQWYEEGALRPHISHRFDLAHGAEALQALLNREVVGKAVLTVRAG